MEYEQDFRVLSFKPVPGKATFASVQRRVNGQWQDSDARMEPDVQAWIERNYPGQVLLSCNGPHFAFGETNLLKHS